MVQGKYLVQTNSKLIGMIITYKPNVWGLNIIIDHKNFVCMHLFLEYEAGEKSYGLFHWQSVEGTIKYQLCQQ